MSLLQMIDIRKSFFGVEVLHGVNFELRCGEVHALIGENGAGKSTLMKVLMGEYTPDSGQVIIAGEAMNFKNPSDALKHGVSKVHQELSPILDMTIAENIFLGREPRKLGFVQSKKQIEKTNEFFEKLGLCIQPKTLMRQLSVAETQMVEIAKAVSYGSNILILDEPTSAIAETESQKLFEIINILKEQGVGIIYISHKLDEIYTIADRITILRDGEYIKTGSVNEIPKQQLINLMVGRELTELYPMTKKEIGETLLSVRGLSRRKEFEDVTFDIHRGEILGLSGLMGSGRTEICLTLFGANKPDCGTIMIDGKQVNIKRPSIAIDNKIALISEDRKQEGLNMKASVEENILSVMQKNFSKMGFINRKKNKKHTEEMVDLLKIKIHSLKQLVSNLSGGNQQKVVIAKWKLTDPDIIIFDEPTRGIDVGAKAEIYKIINEFAKQGKAILIVSSEMPEIIGMCDRVLTIRNGRIVGELKSQEIKQEEIMKLCAN